MSRRSLALAVILLLAVGSGISCGSASAGQLVEQGRKAADQGDWGKAISRYDKAIRKDSTFASAYSNRARADLELGDYEAAISDGEHAIELQPNLLGDLDPTLLSAYVARWGAQLTAARPDGPIADFERVLGLLPNHTAEINRVAATAFLARGKRSLMLVSLRKPDEFTDQDSRLLQGAIDDLDHAQTLDPALARNTVEPKAQSLHKRGLVKYYNAYAKGFTNGVPNDADGMRQAIADLDQALALTPTDGNLFYDRGAIDISLGDRKAAQADRVKAVELGLEDAPHYFGAGMAFWSSRDGDLRLAISYFNKAIGADPKYANAWEYRGRSYALLGDCKAFLSDWNQAKSLTTDKNRLAYFKSYEDMNVYGCFK